MHRAVRLLVPVLLACHALDGEAAAVASGRNWRITIDRLDCEAAGSRLMIAARIGYLGPKGPVETPVSQLVDGKGKPHLPRSLVWKGGGKPLAALLAAGGLKNIQAENTSDIQLNFDLRDASGDLHLEFGDIRAFALTRKRASACEGLLKPDQIQAPRKAAPVRVESSRLDFPVHRGRYPCVPPSRGGEAAWMVAAPHPPYAPRQLLLFGRGYLPNARQIELPMGRAAAQSYAYSGPDDVISIENAARRALAADFPGYAGNPKKVFAFNWGTQKAASGNEVYSIGIYDLRACPK